MALDMREGGTRLDVLAAVAKLEREGDLPPRQKHITEEVTVSKGAVSKTCTDLVEDEHLHKEGNRYRVNEQMLLVVYREHLEEYLVRETTVEPFEAAIERRNDVRGRFKRELRKIVANGDNEQADLLLEIILEVLVGSLDAREIQTERDLLFAIDQQIRMTAAHIVTSQEFSGPNSPGWERIRPLLLTAVALDRGYGTLARLRDVYPDLEAYLPGAPTEEVMNQYLTND